MILSVTGVAERWNGVLHVINGRRPAVKIGAHACVHNEQSEFSAEA
jgi:hypothetical protein